MKRVAKIVFILLLAIVVPASVKADLLGVEYDGTIVRINERNAIGVIVGNAGVLGLGALARVGYGILYTTDNLVNLYTIPYYRSPFTLFGNRR